MKPKELSRQSVSYGSFTVSKHVLPHFLNIWHYHSEIELVYIKKSTGTKFIGDCIERFSPGDLTLIGSNLPHMMMNDQKYFDRTELDAEAWVIHFDPCCLGLNFFDLPEMAMIHQLLEDAKLGLNISGKAKRSAKELMTRILQDDGVHKVIDLLCILEELAMEPKKRQLASHSFINSYGKNPSTKLDMIYEFVLNNFKSEIKLQDVAGLVPMNPSSFSRYFKQTTNKTFKNFLNEVRIGFACKLLLEEEDKNIAEVGFESGFNNLSNFNKQFKNITSRTPSEYLQAHGLIEKGAATRPPIKETLNVPLAPTTEFA